MLPQAVPSFLRTMVRHHSFIFIAIPARKCYSLLTSVLISISKPYLNVDAPGKEKVLILLSGILLLRKLVSVGLLMEFPHTPLSV